jgi:hypothetical protein
MKPLSQETLDFLAENPNDPTQITNQELATAMKTAKLPAGETEIAEGKLSIPEGKKDEQKRFRAFLAGVLSHGGESELKRFIADEQSGENACAAIVRIKSDLRLAAEAFAEKTRAHIANRTKPLPDGKYLMSQNGGPIYVHGGDEAENMDPEELKLLLLEANELGQVQ